METLNGVMERGVDPSENHFATWCLSRWYRLISLAQHFQIVEEAFRWQDVGRTDDNLPVLIGSRHFVSGSQFWVTSAAHDEHEHTREALHILLSLILVPMAVTSAAQSNHDVSPVSQNINFKVRNLVCGFLETGAAVGRPAKKGNCFWSSLSSMASSTKSLTMGVQRDIW